MIAVRKKRQVEDLDKKTREKTKDKTIKQRKRKIGWIVFGSTSVLIILFVVLFIYIYNSFGLRGVVFGVKSGLYDSEINLTMEADGVLLARDTEIKYNLNGDDLKNTNNIYNSEGIKLELPEAGYKLYTVTAMACKDSDDCTDPQVATYILGKNIKEDITVDVININSSQKNLYDYYEGIMVPGRIYDLNEASGSSAYIDGNYNGRGKGWSRDAYITMFDVNGNLVLDQGAYIEISGGTSSSYDIKSMKVTLLAETNADDVDRIKSFRLRSGGQDQFTGNIKSSVASRLISESVPDCGTTTKRVVVFLNGDYYGIFDMQDNFSDLNLVHKFNLDKKKIEKYKGSESRVFKEFGLDEGIWNDLDVLENRERLEQFVDMDNYLKYYAVQIMLNNTDWPMNNFEGWRYIGKNNTSNKYEDGRIRFLVYDTDLIYSTEDGIEWFDGATGDIFEYLMENKYNGFGSSFSKVMKSSHYRTRFINLLKLLMDGVFNSDNVLEVINEEATKIEHQVKIFSSNEEYDSWLNNVEKIKEAASERNDEIILTIRKYFGE